MKINNDDFERLKTLFSIDAYKLGHREQYPKGIELIFANITPRKSTHKIIKDKVVVFGIKYIVKKIRDEWNNNFFSLSENKVKKLLNQYSSFAKELLNIKEYSINHLLDLWEYGKLPLEFRYLSDYKEIDFNIPILLIWNTNKKFFWLVNYLETYLINQIWPIISSVTIASNFYNLFEKFAKKTHNDTDFPKWQGHDFSYRGINSREGAVLSGIGHLAFFSGSDNIPAILEYKKNIDNNKRIGSIYATEHSVMSSGSKEKELQTYENLLDLYPNDDLSIVSDTWDLWNVIDNILPKLKEKILKRKGKLIIRPDSGDIIKISIKTIEKLAKLFGTKTNSKGYKELNPKIGVIYGDSVTIEKVMIILKKLEEKGFASNSIIFGIGASTYQTSTRDTFGIVMKTTYVEINGKGIEIFKDPITSNSKTSAKGILNVRSGKLIQSTTFKEITNKSDFLKFTS